MLLLIAVIILIWTTFSILGGLFSGDSDEMLGTLLGIFVIFLVLSAFIG